MNWAQAGRSITFAALACAALVGCQAPQQGSDSGVVVPQLITPPDTDSLSDPTAQSAPLPSDASLALERYYAQLQASLMSRGLLRRDRGGPDTPFTDAMLARNFRTIALGEEYTRGGGLTPARGGEARVKKWASPIRVNIEFGDLVPQQQRAWDRRKTRSFAARLAQITGHPISMSETNPNYHVIFATHDDLPNTAQRIRELVPDINLESLNVVRHMPRSIHCLVMAFARDNESYEYDTAIAVIRAEHPDLLRLSCIHEELAQGLGVGNDSPGARPSIFNDDDEFALLTRHDEMLLKVLYDPRLRPGMDADQAMPIVNARAAQMISGPS